MRMLKLNGALRGFAQGLAVLVIAGLTSCGGPGEGSPNAPVTPPPTQTVVLSTSQNSISGGSSAILTAKVMLGSTPVKQEVVTFTTDSQFGVFSPASGTALTDANGVATITLTAGENSGAAVVTASTTAATSNSIGYSVLANGPTTEPNVQISMDAPVFGQSPLSAYGTTGVTVRVKNGTATYLQPVEVAFTSVCAANGKATITQKITTVNGEAAAQYKDNGCNGQDTITASITGFGSVTGALTVQAPSIGSIQFVDASPTTITLKGTGGSGLSESSLVRFKVVDVAGNPIKANVSFSLSTSIGGLSLTSQTATSDASTGIVSTNVNSGTVATPVRVTASVVGSTLSTQSDKLSISTGLPDQAHFSLSASTHNIEGWNYDGTQTSLTARLADHFSNPVPDGTAVNFIAEGASIASSCTTSGGVCTVTFNSQELRPSNGRVQVLAYSVGEEAFTDNNGDGYINYKSEFKDANSFSADMPEAYVDYNENNIRESTEPFLDFNGDGIYNAADGIYNGVLCNSPTAPLAGTTVPASNVSGDTAITCPPDVKTRSIHVRGMQTIVLSGSAAFIDINPGSLDLGGCGGAQAINVYIRDLHNNVMPAGTTIVMTVDNGAAVGPTSYRVMDSTSNVQSELTWTFYVKGDGTVSGGVCTDTTPSGRATFTVTTPKGVVTSRGITLSN